MTKTIDFYYDLASPNCYMANKALAGVAHRTGARIVYKPVLLGGVFKATGNQAPWANFGHVKPKMNYMMLEIDRFVRNHALTDYKLNPYFPLNTLLLSRGAVVAELEGYLEAYLKAGEKLMWEDGQKMDDRDVFARGFKRHGLDGNHILERTQEQAIKDKLRTDTDAAVTRGIFGVPSFFVGEEMFFGKDRMAEVEAALAAA